MAELVARGDKPDEVWQRELPLHKIVTLGRDPNGWNVPWEPWLSSRHAELNWQGNALVVRQLPTARNPIFYRGEPIRTVELKPGESFVIGSTLFLVQEKQDETQAEDSVPVVTARTIAASELEHVPFRDAPGRLDVLNRLPEIISSAVDEKELFTHLINMVLAGIPKASAVALVSLAQDGPSETVPAVLHQEARTVRDTLFRPSQRLILEALNERKATVLHVWNVELKPSQPLYTLGGNFDWAFCTPVLNEGKDKWGLYITGQFPVEDGKTLMGPWESNVLSDDLKFTELVTRILRSIMTIKFLEHKQSILGRFFSPEVMHLLATPDPEMALKSQETDVTVLFCDLRGFARKVEAGEADLFALLERVSKALRVMTQNIMDNGGVIADFQGDAAMGFWGWPVPQAEMVSKACQAALGIQTFFESFAQIPSHPLSDFQVGIGLATGRAVAGTIGPENQVKIGVFGPVVNLASRLEGMTKQFRVPILMDEKSAQILQASKNHNFARWRRLACVKPYGLQRAANIYELLPPAFEKPELTDAHLAGYEQALTAFVAGDWPRVRQELEHLPSEDRGRQMLEKFLHTHQSQPPAGWNGVIEMTEK
jgi:adenylate cyclase